MIRCVLIDRDKAAREVLSRYLAKYDISVNFGESGADLRRLLIEPDTVDIVVLDLTLPDADGLALCRWMHSVLRKPLIALTAQCDVPGRLMALDGGADDYIDKPYDPREAVARIRAVLRRTASAQTAGPAAPRLIFGNWTLSEKPRVLHNDDGHHIPLSVVEFRLLQALAHQPGEVLSRAQLIQHMADDAASQGGYLRAVDLAISRLRQKFGQAPSLTSSIRTVRGKGYLLVKLESMP